MSVNFKVIGGTQRHDQKSLCHSCRWAHVAKGFKDSQTIVRCGAKLTVWGDGDSDYRPGDPHHIPFPIYDCTGYSDKRLPTLEEMKLKALKIDPERVRVTGFAPKKDPT